MLILFGETFIKSFQETDPGSHLFLGWSIELVAVDEIGSEEGEKVSTF